MLVLVSYDVCTKNISGSRRLRKVAKICESYGQRVQNSVFECVVDPALFTLLRNKLMKEIKKDEDSLRFYFLGSNWKNRVEHIGIKEIIDVEQGNLVV